MPHNGCAEISNCAGQRSSFCIEITNFFREIHTLLSDDHPQEVAFVLKVYGISRKYVFSNKCGVEDSEIGQRAPSKRPL